MLHVWFAVKPAAWATSVAWAAGAACSVVVRTRAAAAAAMVTGRRASVHDVSRHSSRGRHGPCRRSVCGAPPVPPRRRCGLERGRGRPQSVHRHGGPRLELSSHPVSSVTPQVSDRSQLGSRSARVGGAPSGPVLVAARGRAVPGRPAGWGRLETTGVTGPGGPASPWCPCGGPDACHSGRRAGRRRADGTSHPLARRHHGRLPRASWWPSWSTSSWSRPSSCRPRRTTRGSRH